MYELKANYQPHIIHTYCEQKYILMEYIGMGRVPKKSGTSRVRRSRRRDFRWEAVEADDC